MKKLLLTVILKDDSDYEHVKRMFASFMPYFHGLAVVFNGSGKFTKTISLIEKYKGKYKIITPKDHPEVYDKDDKGNMIFASFAKARDASFELASEMQKEGKYDWWAWADKDDLLIHGEELQKVAKLADENGFHLVFFTYWYAINVHKDGSFNHNDVLIDHVRERLLKPNLWKWVSRLHEVALPKDDAFKPKYSVYNFMPDKEQNCVWAHLPTKDDIDKASQRNAKILEIQAREENHKDPRTLFYLAKTYYDMGDPIKDALAQELIKEYLELSGWPEERSNAWEYLGEIALRRSDKQKAIQFFLKARDEYPMRHMPYLQLAREYADIGQIDLSNFYLEQVSKMEPPVARTTIGNPLTIKLVTASLFYNKAIRETDIEKALYWLDIREKLSGTKDKEAREILEASKLFNEAAIWFHNYAVYLKDTHPELVNKLLTAVTPELAKEPFVQKLSNEIKVPRKWGKKEIAYFASGGGAHFEQWSPKSLQKGIGGSETAVIELTKEWVKLGYKVTVYGDPQSDVGEYEGVEYKPWYEMNWNDTFNILILWRSPHLLDKEIKAKKIFMDLHDVASQLDWTEERMKKVDKVFFKSKFQRDMIPLLPGDKAVIISNGIQT